MPTHTSSPTDADLLSRYMQARDEAAFATLVRAHERLVIGTASRITGNAESARDVAQQVFATLAGKSWMLTNRTSLAGWLHRAARHIALRMARSEAARNRRHQQLALDHPTAPESDVWPILEEALATLSDAEREAVVMHHLQDRSYAEMAVALGLTEATVRKPVSRGIHNLGAQLRKRGLGGSAASLLAGAAAVQMSTPSVAVAATLTSAAPFSLTLTTLMAHSAVKLTISGISLHSIAQRATRISTKLPAAPLRPETKPFGLEFETKWAHYVMKGRGCRCKAGVDLLSRCLSFNHRSNVTQHQDFLCYSTSKMPCICQLLFCWRCGTGVAMVLPEHPFVYVRCSGLGQG